MIKYHDRLERDLGGKVKFCPKCRIPILRIAKSTSPGWLVGFCNCRRDHVLTWKGEK